MLRCRRHCYALGGRDSSNVSSEKSLSLALTGTYYDLRRSWALFRWGRNLGPDADPFPRGFRLPTSSLLAS
jgi:hypothetical protein